MAWKGYRYECVSEFPYGVCETWVVTYVCVGVPIICVRGCRASLRDAKLTTNDFVIKSNAGLEFRSRF